MAQLHSYLALIFHWILTDPHWSWAILEGSEGRCVQLYNGVEELAMIVKEITAAYQSPLRPASYQDYDADLFHKEKASLGLGLSLTLCKCVGLILV